MVSGYGNGAGSDSGYGCNVMTDEEFDELDAFLLSDACDEQTLAIEELHGYLTALQLTPEGAALSEWQSAVWGEPEFADETQRQRLSAMLEAMRNEIAETLRRRELFEPMVVEMEEDGLLVESYEGWCYGFMLGVEQDPQQWQALPASAQGLLAPMARLALLADEEEDEEMSEEEYNQWVELIPGAVLGLYDLWHRD